jgi:hypothetical protein
MGIFVFMDCGQHRTRESITVGFGFNLDYNSKLIFKKIKG